MQVFQRQAVHAFIGKDQRHFIDRRDIFGGDYRVLFDVAEECDFRFDLLGEEAISPAEQDVGLNPHAQKLFYRVLRWFCLQLAGCADPGDERDVHEQRVFTA